MVRDDTRKPNQAGMPLGNPSKEMARTLVLCLDICKRKSRWVIKSSSEVEVRGEAGDRADTCTVKLVINLN
jgi:hypothetical protein